MRRRAFTVIISVDDTPSSSAWLMEDRKHPVDSDRHRTARLALDLRASDIDGLHPDAILSMTVFAIAEALKKSERGHIRFI